MMGDSPWGAAADKRAPRTNRVFKASIVSEGRGEYPIIVRNLSAHGIGGRGLEGLAAGERISFRLNGELIEGEVSWVRGDRFGAKLHQEIDPSAFTFGHKNWDAVHSPIEPGHVFEQFKPVSDPRRPGLKVR